MKKSISFLLSLILFFTLISPAAFAAADNSAQPLAQTLAVGLKSLGLIQGVSEADFDLNREPTRMEAVVMLIRVLGEDSSAKASAWEQSFSDVPPWASSYIAYAHSKGLVNGISDTQFGSSSATSQTFLALMLRALGYSDINGADFTYADPYSLAQRIGLLPDYVDRKDFLRADAVIIMYASLNTVIKGTRDKLANRLISDGVFTKAQYDTVYKSDTLEKAEQDVKSGALLTGNPYATLKTYLKLRGKFEPMAGGYELKVSGNSGNNTGYLIFRPGTNDLLGLCYLIDGPTLTTETLSISSGLNTDFTIEFNRVIDTLSGVGRLTKSSFDPSMTLPLSSYSGREEDDAGFAWAGARILGEILYAADSILRYNKIPVTLNDLGFTAFYNLLRKS